MSVDIAPDLHSAKVYCSAIGGAEARTAACAVLNAVAGQISHLASRKVRMRSFPRLRFYIDEGLEKQLRICEILEKVAPHGSKCLEYLRRLLWSHLKAFYLLTNHPGSPRSLW